MSTENQTSRSAAALDSASWSDFVDRTCYYCNGAEVRRHNTDAAIFTVQTKRIDYSYEIDYAEGRVVCLEDQSRFSPKGYWEDLDDKERAEIDQALIADRECSFMDLKEDDQWEYLAECDDHTVTVGTNGGRS